MKQIIAVIHPHVLARVEQALQALPQSPGFTLLRAKGHGRRSAGHGRRAMDWERREE